MMGAVCFLLLMGAMGYLVLSLFCSARHGLAWLTGFSMLLGAALTGMLLQALSLLGIVPTRTVLMLLAIACVMAAVRMHRAGRLAGIERASTIVPAWQRGLSLLVFVTSLGTAVRLSLELPPEWDGFAIWLLKAKVLATEPLLPLPAYFLDVSLSFSHLDYPLLLPFLVAGCWAAAGAADPLAAHAVFLYFDLAAMLALYGVLGLRNGVLASALLCAALFLVPGWLRWAVAPVADLPLAAFGFASLVLLIDAVEKGDARLAVLAAILAAATALTKLEGLPLAFINAVAGCSLALACHPPRVRLVLGFVLIAVLLLLPWLLFSQALPHTHENYAGRLEPALLASNLRRLPEIILPAIAGQLVAVDRWGLVWVLPLLLAVPGWKAFCERRTVILWLACAGQFALYALAYTITPWDLQTLLPVSLERLLLHAAPVAVLVTGAHAAVCVGSSARP